MINLPPPWDAIEQAYHAHCTVPSDINEHLPVLRAAAEGMPFCVEFGVRGVVSTWALLAARPKTLVCVDIDEACAGRLLPAYQAAFDAGITMAFTPGDTATLMPIPCDLLFIDTLHTYEHLTKELAQHAGLVRHRIALHDTVSYGDVGMDGRAPGLRAAVAEFLGANPAWQTVVDLKNNNGFMVLERR